MVDGFLRDVVSLCLKDLSGETLVFVQGSACKALFPCSCPCVLEDVSGESLFSWQLSVCFCRMSQAKA